MDDNKREGRVGGRPKREVGLLSSPEKGGFIWGWGVNRELQ